MEKSLFSKIIDREIPGHVVYEDDNVIAFLDINPVNEGHTLVVPKNEKENMMESSEEDIVHVMAVVRKLVPAIMEVTGASGCNVVSNIGASDGQSVFHTHVHIIPRHENDGLQMWPQRSVTSEELSATGERIRKAL